MALGFSGCLSPVVHTVVALLACMDHDCYVTPIKDDSLLCKSPLANSSFLPSCNFPFSLTFPYTSRQSGPAGTTLPEFATLE